MARPVSQIHRIGASLWLYRYSNHCCWQIMSIAIRQPASILSAEFSRQSFSHPTHTPAAHLAGVEAELEVAAVGMATGAAILAEVERATDAGKVETTRRDRNRSKT